VTKTEADRNAEEEVGGRAVVVEEPTHRALLALVQGPLISQLNLLDAKQPFPLRLVSQAILERPLCVLLAEVQALLATYPGG